MPLPLPVSDQPVAVLPAGVVVDEVKSFSDRYCTAASYEEGIEHAANYTGWSIFLLVRISAYFLTLLACGENVSAIQAHCCGNCIVLKLQIQTIFISSTVDSCADGCAD